VFRVLVLGTVAGVLGGVASMGALIFRLWDCMQPWCVRALLLTGVGSFLGWLLVLLFVEELVRALEVRWRLALVVLALLPAALLKLVGFHWGFDLGHEGLPSLWRTVCGSVEWIADDGVEVLHLQFMALPLALFWARALETPGWLQPWVTLTAVGLFVVVNDYTIYALLSLPSVAVASLGLLLGERLELGLLLWWRRWRRARDA